MNNSTIIIRIHFAVTLFQHSPLTRRVFFNNIRRERGQHHQQHQVGERTTSSISSWNIDWRIYKSLEVFLINNIVILKGMKSSSASIWISIKLIHHHHNTRLVTSSEHEADSSSQYWIGFTSQLSSWKHSTHLAFRHSNQAGSTILVLFFVIAIKLEARYSSCFSS
jgi:hypothetical protein